MIDRNGLQCMKVQTDIDGEISKSVQRTMSPSYLYSQQDDSLNLGFLWVIFGNRKLKIAPSHDTRSKRRLQSLSA